MSNSNRRDFLKTTTLAGLAFATTSFDYKKYRPLLSFATLGCPDWSYEKILNFAQDNDYDGIEFRGLQRQFDLTKCIEFSSPENIIASAKLAREKKIKIVDLGSSAVMHISDPTERKKNLDEAKRFIQLAQQLSCPYIRLFGDKFQEKQEKNRSIEFIAQGLKELCDYAKGTDVKVLLSTHGDIVYTADIENIMQLAGCSNVGIGWDIVNMWSATKEPLSEVYARLKKYIHLVHVKDLKMEDGKEQDVLLGKGNMPIFEGIDILAKNDYRGYYSFVWEKYWAPKIEEPEVAFADYARVMKRHFKW